MKRYWLLLILPALLIVWWGIGRGDSGPVVHFTSVKRITISSTVATNGKAEPAQWAAARAEIAGVVRTISVQRGQVVKAGQPLVTLDTAAAQSALTSALAQEQQARTETATLGHGGRPSQLAAIEDQVRTAQTTLEIAQRNYDSMRRLASEQAATKLQVLDAKDALDRAKLQLQAAQDRRQTLVTSSDKTDAQARLENAQAAVALAKHQLQLGTIVAPNAGTVYQFDLKLGAYLQPGDLVALIGDLDRMKVMVYVDEPDLGRVGLGMAVNVTWDARPGQRWWGRVDRMPTEVVALGSRTVGEVTTIVENPNHDLLPGVSVNATVVSKIAKDALGIPKAGLRTLNGSDGVYKLSGNKIVWTPVKTGISDVNSVEIFAGLGDGDKVADRVVEPSDAEIRDGMRVRPVFD
ncbi:MAG: efflux RND transporter periplasmic adaptor subunit [Acidobacteriaceae bacterium]|nr:efflux RND transporter periplasmic adaptor subunit [Acidobacteriaceae bacterium]